MCLIEGMSHVMEMPSPSNEAQRRRTLRNHKIFVTSLLGVAAVIFLACSWWQSQGTAPGWVGYVRAAAEAGMVGGLADWFAVTALFKHPMRIPIPHTAIIPNKKDQVADALSEFVSENFLNAQTITSKVMEARIPERVGKWLVQPANAERVSAELGTFAARMIRGINPKDAEAFLQTYVVDRVAEPIWGPPLGRMLEGFIADGKVEPVVDDILAWARTKVDEMEEPIVTTIDQRMPTWAPQFAKDLVGARVYRELTEFVADVDEDENHQARRAIRRTINQFAQDLQFDGAMISRVEDIKADVMASAAVTAAPGQMWEQLSTTLLGMVEDGGSALRRQATSSIEHWGMLLADDPSTRATATQKLETAVHFAAENGADQIVGIIAETIQTWDGAEAADKIELMVGKDLQFIRLNGTLVGALAGLVIYTVSQVLFF